MRNVWNAEYRRWQGESVGVWQRRLSIARYGLKLCLSGKMIRIFLVLALAQTVFMSVVFFAYGQLVAPESSMIAWLGENTNPQFMRILNALTSWVLLYPEICVDGIYRIFFALLRFTNPMYSVILVALFVHRLIANDLASNAIVIYNSKALTRWDYLIGKFMVVSTILSVVWIVPVVASWILGNALSPDWSFFYHSFPSLVRGLVVAVVAVVSLSCLAMLVSSLAKKTGTAVGYWAMGWLILSVIAKSASVVFPALANLSPISAISKFSAGVFRLGELLADARGMLPFFDSFFSRVSKFDSPDQVAIGNGSLLLPLVSLAIYSVVGLYIVSRRVRTK